MLLDLQLRPFKYLKYLTLAEHSDQIRGRGGVKISESELDFLEPQKYVNHGPPPRRMRIRGRGGTRASSPRRSSRLDLVLDALAGCR
jgi:hypothetical protein